MSEAVKECRLVDQRDAREIETLYDAWRLMTRRISSVHDAIINNEIIRYLKRMYDPEDIICVLFTRTAGWSMFEMGIISELANDPPKVPERDLGRLDPVREIFRAWGRARGYYQ